MVKVFYHSDNSGAYDDSGKTMQFQWAKVKDFENLREFSQWLDRIEKDNLCCVEGSDIGRFVTDVEGERKIKQYGRYRTYYGVDTTHIVKKSMENKEILKKDFSAALEKKEQSTQSNKSSSTSEFPAQDSKLV